MPPIAILHAPGTNRDIDAALACRAAGGAPEIVHINQLLSGERRLDQYAMLVIPGGFSYGDDLGAGKLWAVRLLHEVGDQLLAFVDAGKPVIGICNGFQVLVKTGILPGPLPDVALPERAEEQAAPAQTVTLTRNASARFECRWVHLSPNPDNPSPWLVDLDRIHCPVAHGEGRFVPGDDRILESFLQHHLVAFTYTDAQGRPGPYPINPNGSAADIAGITNKQGNVLGLMPHPEDHIFPGQSPHRHRGQAHHLGLKLFQNGVAYAHRFV